MFKNILTNAYNLLLLIQLIIICYVTVEANTEASICNKTETHLSDLIDSTFDTSELPADLLVLTDNLSKSNTTVLGQNCSDILTLKHFLYERATKPTKDDLPKSYYTALYAYLEMKYYILHYHKSYIPKTNADIILLTKSFASTNLSPVLERKVHLYFFYYGNWLEKLTQCSFPFDRYKNPRSLLLDMICELINDPLYRPYEREVIFFLIMNNYTCSFLRDDYRLAKRSESIHAVEFHEFKSNAQKTNSEQRFTLKWPDHNDYPTNISRYENSSLERSTNVNNSGDSNNIILLQNISITVLNNKILPNISFKQSINRSKMFLNFSIINSIKLKHLKIQNFNQTSIAKPKEHQPQITTTVSFLSINNNSMHNANTSAFDQQYITTSEGLRSTLYKYQTVQTLNISTSVQTTNITVENIPTASPSLILGQEEPGPTSSYVLDVVEHEPVNSSYQNFTQTDTNQNSQQDKSQDVQNFTVWDIVEMDGPCKEGQQHVVKLNVQSLLTAIDEHVSNSSIELFRKLLNNVKMFPIEDYNARGELLRDLIPVISKEQADPLIKKSIEDILDHVILDGPGDLPPKIKLECVDAPEENIKRTARRTRRVFNLQFN